MSSQLSAVEAANALPVGHRLHEFELRGVIGVGGFGIVYRAFDHSLEREVAIKEYMPATLAGRSGKHQVSLLSQAHAETFALGLGSFVNEARLLARFDHASLVKVHRFWEEHGTAYMVMPLYRGRTLRELRLSMSQPPDEAWIRNLMEHLLGALEVLHREAVYHRDIAPDNILVSGDAAPVLLDFGAARRVISDRSQTLTAILKPSYAPIEQYAESTGLRQGPWTDFYALGATLHFVITGKPPMPATARAINDDQPRLAGSGQGGLSDRLLQVCDWMIAPRPADRPQNASEVRATLAGRMPIPVRTAPATETSWQNTVVQQTPPEPVLAAAAPPRPRRTRKLLTLTTAAAVAAVAVFALGRGVGEGRARMAVSAKTTASAGPSQPGETVAHALAPVAAAPRGWGAATARRRDDRCAGGLGATRAGAQRGRRIRSERRAPRIADHADPPVARGRGTGAAAGTGAAGGGPGARRHACAGRSARSVQRAPPDRAAPLHGARVREGRLPGPSAMPEGSCDRRTHAADGQCLLSAGPRRQQHCRRRASPPTRGFDTMRRGAGFGYTAVFDPTA